MIITEKKYPKVLILSRNAWNNNCTGNTLTNFFTGWPIEKIANAFFRAEPIDNTICNRYFRVTETELVRNIFKKNNIGKQLNFNDISKGNLKQNCAQVQQERKKEKGYYSFFSRHRWILMLWLRDFLWGLGGWKNNKYNMFLDEVRPDVIYMPCYDSAYMHWILWYTAKRTGARIVLFTGDDTYTLKQFNLSPLYWINRFLYRSVMRKSVNKADTLFVISDLQKQEYDRIFNRNCILLRKGGDFNRPFTPKDRISQPIKLVYTGNIHSGRWKTLAKLANALKDLNTEKIKMQMDIYSLSAKTAKMSARLNIEGSSRLMPTVSGTEITNALQNADILVFVEPFALKEKLIWRLSFSTKIIDYLASSRAILAIGPKKLASTDYLLKHDAALCITEIGAIKAALSAIADQPEIIKTYAFKAWECGETNNKIEDTREILRRGLAKES